MNRYLFCLIVFVCLINSGKGLDDSNSTISSSTPYTRMDSSQILQNFIDFQKAYPNYFKLKYINDNSSIDFTQTKCGKGILAKDCLYFYAEITDFQNNGNSQKSLPQVLFTGGLQGNNTIGPNIVAYLAEYILKNAQSTKISSLLQQRLIVLYPIPNPQGFSTYNSQELQLNSRRINVEADFPYFTNKTQDDGSLACLQSVSAKALTYLFQNYLFTIGASFNLGDTPSIQYPRPDSSSQIQNDLQDYIQQTISQNLQKNSLPNSKLYVPVYTISKLTSSDSEVKSFYEWANIMAYNQNTDPNISQLPLCSSVLISQQSISQITNSCQMYKIVCSKLEPSEQTYGDKESSNNLYSSKAGHISRNIQLSMELIEMAGPFISSSVKIFNKNNIYLQWYVDGCFTLTNTQLYYRVLDNSTTSVNLDAYNSLTNIQSDFTLVKSIDDQPGYLISDQNSYSYTWNFQNQTNIDIIITASCDQQWQDTVNPENQSTFLQLRTNPIFNVTNNQFKLNSHQFLIANIPFIQSVQTKVSQDQQLQTLKSQKHKETFQFWMGILAGLGGLILIFIFIAIYVKCRDRYRDYVDLKLLPSAKEMLDLTNNTQANHNTSEVNQLNFTKPIEIGDSRADDILNFSNYK